MEPKFRNEIRVFTAKIQGYNEISQRKSQKYNDA